MACSLVQHVLHLREDLIQEPIPLEVARIGLSIRIYVCVAEDPIPGNTKLQHQRTNVLHHTL